MIFEWIRFALCALCLITALVCFTAAVLGANRFGFIMNRVHAGGVGDTLGLFLVAMQYGGVQWLSFLAVPLLLAYNGQRGKANIGKLFYWYYPVHLVVIYGISLFV